MFVWIFIDTASNGCTRRGQPIWFLCPVAKPYLQFRFFDGRSFWFALVLLLRVSSAKLWSMHRIFITRLVPETKLMPFKYYRIREWSTNSGNCVRMNDGISPFRSTYEQGDVTINSIHFLCKRTISFTRVFAQLKGWNLNILQTHEQIKRERIALLLL